MKMAKNSENGFLIPVLLATLIPFINFLLVLFYLPETKPRNNQSKLIKKTESNPFKGLFKVFKDTKTNKEC